MGRVLSGIQPTGDIHIGNYIGALQHWVADQDVNDAFYCLADLHSITLTAPDPEVPGTQHLEAAATLLAVGVDPAKLSKSAESPLGTLLVNDSPDEIERKIRSAVTDSGREVVAAPEKPALSNLLTIFSVVAGRPVPGIESEYAGRGYADFKRDL